MLGAKFAPEWSLTEEVEPEILLASARAEAERDVYFVPSRGALEVRPIVSHFGSFESNKGCLNTEHFQH